MPFCLIEEIKVGEIRLVFIQNSFILDKNIFLLTEKEQKRLTIFSTEKRKKEYVGIITLKNYFFENEEIAYHDNGAPFLLNRRNQFISISHSHIYIGMILANFKIGLDIELIADKVKRVTSKFVSEKEALLFDIHSAEEMTRIWTMKEALYKVVSSPGIDIKEHIQIERKNEVYFGSVFINEQWYVTEIATFVKDNYIFSFNIKALVQK
jgi:4'-phosphopantetheinyl transferase